MTYEGNLSSDVKLALGEALTDASESAARHFRDHHQSKRFTKRHARKAGYRPRSKSYLKFKQTRFKTDAPLTKTGTLRKQVENPEIVTVTGLLTGSSTGETSLNYRRSARAMRFPQIEKEFTTLLPEEQQEFAERVANDVNRRLER